jgi:hypothetical protein
MKKLNILQTMNFDKAQEAIEKERLKKRLKNQKE